MTSCVFETWSESAVATSHASFSPIRRDARPGPQAGGDLRVVTTRLRPGYLRKNGVPYSENATMREYFDAFTEPNGDNWLVIDTIVTNVEKRALRMASISAQLRELRGRHASNSF